MKPTTKYWGVAALKFYGIAALLAGPSIAKLVSAAEPDRSVQEAPGEQPSAEEQLKNELIALGKEYERLMEEANRAERSGTVPADDISDEEWLRQAAADRAKNSDPCSVMLPKFLAFAKTHRNSPLALDALAFIVRGPYTNDVLALPWRIKEQAIEEVAAQHLNDPRTIHVFDMICEGNPSHKTELLLKQAIEKGVTPAIRAAAGVCLARYDQNLGYLHGLAKKLKTKTPLLVYERFLKLIVSPHVEENFPYDSETMSAEMDRLLAEVMQKYANVEAKDWKLIGENRLFLEADDFPKPKTYGDLAKSLLFELHNLAPGKKAPDIVGTDAEDKTFRLSDYRGKVVLLTFSANCCGACAELYPQERAMVKKFHGQPFAMLSVSRDESIDTLKESIASGEITWRCWWDGHHGPIWESWNSPGAPSVHLLDQDGIIQDVRLVRTSSEKEFEEAIEALLAKPPGKQLAPH